MDLINWSLNAIETILDEKLMETYGDYPDGTFAAGYTMDAWERWRIMCLAALSVEDIEDLPIRNHDNRYFADWICPGLSNNSEDGNSCPKPHKAARLD